MTSPTPGNVAGQHPPTVVGSIRPDTSTPAATPRDFFEPTLRGYLKHLIWTVLIVSVVTTTRVVFEHPVTRTDVLVPLVLLTSADTVACFVPFLRRPLNRMFR